MTAFCLYMEQAPIQPGLPSNLTSDSAFPEWDKYDPTTHAIGDFLNVTMSDPQDYESNKDKIRMIKDWAYQNAGSKDKTDLLWFIKQAERKISPPQFGERRINNLFKWVRLEMDKMRIMKEQRLFESQGSFKRVKSPGVKVVPKPMAANPAKVVSRNPYRLAQKGMKVSIGDLKVSKPRALPLKQK